MFNDIVLFLNSDGFKPLFVKFPVPSVEKCNALFAREKIVPVNPLFFHFSRILSVGASIDFCNKAPNNLKICFHTKSSTGNSVVPLWYVLNGPF